MKEREYRYFACDFETTVYDGQESTEVWASACVELYSDDVKIFHSIDETWDWMVSLKDNIICYYHNLKFDGNFWLWFFMYKLKYEQAFEKTGHGCQDYEFLEFKYMKNKTFKYSISDMGQWYTITIKMNNKMIQFRDSYKLLPFSIKTIGQSFKTKHKKLDMEYVGFRYAGCEITKDEQEYIANDVLVLKEALEIMFNEGHNKLTIGACCLEEFKKTIGKHDFQVMLPDIYQIKLDESFGQENAGEYIRKSYKGGWCYLVKGKEDTVYGKGVTADVNSLYPSMMSSESGNRYPIGKPYFWKGNFIPDEAIASNKYYFIRIKTRFYLKENMLPFIQIKGSWLYKANECLESSDVVNLKTGKRNAFYKDFDGNLCDTRVTLTLTCIDYKLFLEHYNVFDFEILDGCWFYSEIGIFDEYINKYKKIKMENKGALRTLAKLFLNNLYGKMASNKNSSFKLAVKDENIVGFSCVPKYDKEAGYIPIGSAITSYARNFTIRTAQKNYYGKDKDGFIYADTDSIHCNIPAEKLIGVPVHDTDFCHWKLENFWDKAIFVRQKTYIEHTTHEDGIPVDVPYYNIKCAGMPEKCKNLFNLSMKGYKITDVDNYSDEEKEFISKKRTIKDFKRGLIVPGKLIPKRIIGGVLLVETSYEMRY